MEKGELLKRVRRIEIKTRAMANSVFAGGYHSAFKGRGMSFAEVREYRAGDDVRDVDWNVTARLNRPYVKVFEEERELTVMLLVDVSGSHDFGTREKTVRELAAEVAASLAFSAIDAGDKIGMLLFADGVEKFIPPAKGRRHVLYLIRELLEFTPTGRHTNIGAALTYMTKAIKRRCVCFVLSDFIADTHYSDPLMLANRRHDVVAVRLYDQHMAELPNVGLVKVEDAETGHKVYVDTSSRSVREAHSRWWNDQNRKVDETLRRCGVDDVSISTDGDYVRELLLLFAKRG